MRHLLLGLLHHGFELRQISAGLRLLHGHGVQGLRMRRGVRLLAGCRMHRNVLNLLPLALFFIAIIDKTAGPVAAQDASEVEGLGDLAERAARTAVKGQDDVVLDVCSQFGFGKLPQT